MIENILLSTESSSTNVKRAIRDLMEENQAVFVQKYAFKYRPNINTNGTFWNFFEYQDSAASSETDNYRIKKHNEWKASEWHIGNRLTSTKSVFFAEERFPISRKFNTNRVFRHYLIVLITERYDAANKFPKNDAFLAFGWISVLKKTNGWKLEKM